jgi:hypothetical protein
MPDRTSVSFFGLESAAETDVGVGDGDGAADAVLAA